jgi:hypothetical protein
MPSEYKEKKVIEKAGVKNGVEVTEDSIFIDKERLSKEYSEDLYLRDNTDSSAYNQIGLQGFRAQDNLFANESMYFKYAIEREYQRFLYPIESLTTNKDYLKFVSLTKKYNKDLEQANKIAYEKYLNQRALINSFNRQAIMGLPNNSYTDMVLNMIEEFPNLKNKYPILAQLTKPKVKSGESVLSLNDIKMLKDPQLAEVYYTNIKDLANIDVVKSTDTEDNKRISKLFSLLPNMMIYQHGIGYSKYGFVETLPYEDYIGVMQNAADIFKTNNLNEATLDLIYKRLIDSKGAFKNYVSEPTLYRNGLSRVQSEELVPEILAADSPEIQALLALVPGGPISEETPTQPSTNVKEGVQDVFNSTPELALIGTQEQYSRYLNSVFPQSKVKDILYRGSQNPNKIEATDIDPEQGSGAKNLGKGIYLAKDKSFADKYSGEQGRTSAFISNVPDFHITALQKNWDRGYRSAANITVRQFTDVTSNAVINFDGIDTDQYTDDFNMYGGRYTGSVDENGFPTYQKNNKVVPTWNQLAVNSNSQVLALGSNQDIENFKNFVSNQPEMKRDTPIQPEVSNENKPEGLPGIPRTSSSCK